MKLLVVDDDVLIRRVVLRLFRGHDVTTVATVAEAREAMRSHSWDRILSDVCLLDGTGTGLHQWAVELFPNLADKMVFMSGGMPKADQKYILEHGLPLIAKPFTPPAIRAIVLSDGSA